MLNSPRTASVFLNPEPLNPKTLNPQTQNSETQKSKWLRFSPMFSFILWWGERVFVCAFFAAGEDHDGQPREKEHGHLSHGDPRGVDKMISFQGGFPGWKLFQKKRKGSCFFNREEEQKETPMDSM
jgi:hypothetical protein